MKNIFLVLFAMVMLSACKKDKMLLFNEKAGISFYIMSGTGADSTNFSFANQIHPQLRDTLFVQMRVMGTAVDHPREIAVKALPATTAKEGINFILPKITLPAGALTIAYPIILINTDDLKTNTYHLEIAVSENADFVQGAVGQADVTTESIPVYKINFNNQLIEPDYWDYIAGYFGDYSNVKYQFMIEVCGFSDFTPDYIGGNVTYSDFLNYNVKMKNALKKYTDINGPMLDETGLAISFPL